MSVNEVDLATQRKLETLMTEFGYLVDNGMADRVHELFTDDGSINGPGLSMQSKAEIADKFAERAKDKARVSRHIWTNPRFERLDESTVRVTTVVQTYVHTLVAEQQLPAPGQSFIVGDSIDVMRLGSDERWRFLSRELVVIFRSS